MPKYSNKCLMSHQYPNGSSIEYPKRCAWQRPRTLNKRVSSGDIEGRQEEKKL